MNRPLTTALGWRLPGWLLDVGPVLLILLVGGGAIAARPAGAGQVGDSAALLVIAVALLLRHRAPLGVLAVVLTVSFAVDNGGIVMLPILLAVFTVAEYSDRAKLLIAAAVAVTVTVVTPAAHGGGLKLAAIVSRVIAVGLALAVGLYLRARADYVSGLHERAERLERERELLAQQAVADERVRIARELHDVVAHNVSLMVVQAQALAATSNGDAGKVHTLGRVADLGREALSEMHRMLGVLRVQNGDSPEREPQPGVRDLGRLIARTRETGLGADLTIDGDARDLPPGVDLSAYRIVQEALTNVVRHAGADHATVTLRYGPHRLEVTVTDDGIGARSAQTHPGTRGHGLVGMRERVSLFGGTLETSLGPDGRGYRVHAVLPVD